MAYRLITGGGGGGLNFQIIDRAVKSNILKSKLTSSLAREGVKREMETTNEGNPMYFYSNLRGSLGKRREF